MKTTIYGVFAVGSPPASRAADHILGARVQADSQDRPMWVDIQWMQAGTPQPVQIQLDFVNAMFLLSLLKCIQLDSGYPFPDDPRAPS
jgi:hypothetical protein